MRNKIFVLTALCCLVFLQKTQAQTPQKAIPYPDCIIAPTFTATGAAIVQQSQNPIACQFWTFTFFTNGVPTVVSIEVDTAPDNAGVPGSWTPLTATNGNNPSTSTTSDWATFGSVSAPVAFPWWQINLTTLTGGGKITAFLYGWKLSANSGGGGGGPVMCADLPALTGDVHSSAGSCATIVVGVNGAVVPGNQVVLGTNSLGQIGGADARGTGPRVQLANNNSVTPGDCVNYDADGNTEDAGFPCGSGGGGGGVANYTQNFSSQTSVTLTHNLGTTAVLTQCTDGSNGAGNLLIPANIDVTDSNDVVASFSVSQSGSCTVNGSGTSNPQIVIANESSTGTTANTLTKLTGAPSTAIIVATTDTGGDIGITISGAGTAGNATIQIAGLVNCVFSNATTAGDYVQISTGTAGDCLDTGAATYPVANGQVIGRVLSTNGSAGTYPIDLFPSEIQASNVATIGGLGTNVKSFLETPSGANFNSMIQAGGVPIPQNSQSTAYTTVLADGGGQILHPTADNNARTFTIAANASVAYAVGTTLTFVNQINTVTIAIASDTLQLAGSASTGSRTLAAGGLATAIKIASTLWFISGPGLT